MYLKIYSIHKKALFEIATDFFEYYYTIFHLNIQPR